MSRTWICGHLPHTSARDSPLCKPFTCQSATSLPPCHKSWPSSIPISQAPLTDRNVYICAEVRRQYAGRCPSSARAALDFEVYINYNARAAGLPGYRISPPTFQSPGIKRPSALNGGSFIHQTDHLSHYLLIIVKIKEFKLEVVIIADEVLCLTSWSFFSSWLFCLRS